MKEDGSMGHLPLFDGTNYAYCKACMQEFIEVLDERAWKFGWSYPTKIDDEGQTIPKLKFE